MNPTTDTVFPTFYRFLGGQLPILDFAEWVYSDQALVSILGSDWDTELLAFDYRAPQAERALRRLIRRVYEAQRPGEETEMLFWRLDVIDAAMAFLNGTLSLIDAATRLTYLCENMHQDCWSDPDFSVGWSITVEADTIASAQIQAHMSETAREEAKRDEEDFEATYRPKLEAAAHRLIERFHLR